MPRPQQSGLGISIHRNTYANPAILEGNWQENRSVFSAQNTKHKFDANSTTALTFQAHDVAALKREPPAPSESLPAELLFSDAERPDPRQFGTIAALSFRPPQGPHVSHRDASDCRKALNEPEVASGRTSLIAAKRAEWARERGVVINAAPRGDGATASSTGAALLANGGTVNAHLHQRSHQQSLGGAAAMALSRSLSGTQTAFPNTLGATGGTTGGGGGGGGSAVFPRSFGPSPAASTLGAQPVPSAGGAALGTTFAVRAGTFLGIHANEGVLQGPGALPGATVNRHGLPGGSLSAAASSARHPFGYALPANQPVAADRKTVPWSASGYGLGFTDAAAAASADAIGPVGFTQLGAPAPPPEPGTAPLPPVATDYSSETMVAYGPGIRCRELGPDEVVQM